MKGYNTASSIIVEKPLVCLVFLPVKPQAKERPRLSRGHTYTPKKTVDAEKAIRDAWQARFSGPPLQGPLTVMMTFVILRPKSRKPLKERFHTQKPDADNLAKLVCDALNGVVWVDDSQICDLHVVKVYTDDGERVGVHLSVETIIMK